MLYKVHRHLELIIREPSEAKLLLCYRWTPNWPENWTSRAENRQRRRAPPLTGCRCWLRGGKVGQLRDANVLRYWAFGMQFCSERSCTKLLQFFGTNGHHHHHQHHPLNGTNLVWNRTKECDRFGANFNELWSAVFNDFFRCSKRMLQNRSLNEIQTIWWKQNYIALSKVIQNSEDPPGLCMLGTCVDFINYSCYFHNVHVQWCCNSLPVVMGCLWCDKYFYNYHYKPACQAKIPASSSARELGIIMIHICDYDLRRWGFRRVTNIAASSISF